MKRKPVIIDGVVITPQEEVLIRACIVHRQRKGLDDRLQKSINTINSQLRYLFRKLDVISFTDLVSKARDNGYDKNGKYKPPKQ